ncbi:MAG TPA: chemotaxis protein CheW [Dongiaceae bacterium]|nr:chemotaxis protein CheW [Dongiaceae bacterium]
MEHKQADHPALNWTALKEKMRAVEQRLQDEFEPSSAQIRDRLQQRATRLATKPAAEDHEKQLNLLVFELSEETYAVEARHVVAVVPLRQLTPIPCTPEFVLGVMNVRGNIRSVVDLRRFFELPLAGLSDLNSVVLLGGPEMEFCLLADRILGNRSFPAAQLQSSLSNLTGVRADYLLGVTWQHWAVLDANKLLRDSRLIVNDT